MNPIQTFAINTFISEYLEISEIAQLRCTCKDTKKINPKMKLYKQIYLENSNLITIKDLEPFRYDLTNKDVNFHHLYRTVLISLFTNELSLYRIVRACNIQYFYAIWDKKNENIVVKNVVDTLNNKNLELRNKKYIESFFSLRKCLKSFEVLYDENENKIIFINH